MAQGPTIECMPVSECPTFPEKVDFVKKIIDFLFTKHTIRVDGSLLIECEDCKNYEKHLQKLENDVRQHIRLEQQLKLYQEGLE